MRIFTPQDIVWAPEPAENARNDHCLPRGEANGGPTRPGAGSPASISARTASVWRCFPVRSYFGTGFFAPRVARLVNGWA